MILLVVDTQKGCFNENLYAFETGFNIFVPVYTNSTCDNPYFDKETAYKYFNEFMWGKRYAKIITMDQAIQILQSKISTLEI